MKKAGIILLALVLIFGAFMTLTACEGSDSLKLPGSAWEKVNFAFNGVEQSFNNGSGRNAAPTGGSKIYGASMTTDEALDAIRGVYVDSDRETWNEQEQLDYDQPPMAQFRYMKAVFESIGEGYSFGTKYHDVVSGYIYFDPETGFRSPKTEEYKYPYSIDFAMAISIDDKDDIYCEVSFLIDITKSSGSIQTKWYVSFVIDYDMTNTTPNYTMLMLTDNQEGDLSYRHVQGYEYDYVDVKDNTIVEWRKFFMECENPIVIDEAHPDFTSYENAGLQYNADTCKWYAGNTYRKVKQMNAGKMQTIARAFVDGLGMNTTNINAAPFFDKAGEQNAAISAYYRTISEMKGEELIYDLVCKKEDHESEGDPAKSWPAQFLESQGISSIVPRFTSTGTLSYSVRYDNTESTSAEVTISGASESDFLAYSNALEIAGFAQQQVDEEGYLLYVKEMHDQYVMVAINIRGQAIFIGVAQDGAGGEAVQNIDIMYSLPFAIPYKSYQATDIMAKDVAISVEEISGGMVSASDIMENVSGSGKHYEIILDDESGDLAGVAAKAKTYYFNDVLASWALFAEGAPAKWTTVGTNHVDVVIIVVDDVRDGKAVLDIYVFAFNENSVRTLVDAVQQGSGNGQGEGQGGNEGGNGGNEGGNGSNGEDVNNDKTHVYAWNIDAEGKKEMYRDNIWSNVDTVQVWNYGDGWIMYMDEACTQPADFINGFHGEGGDCNIYRKDKDNYDLIGVTYVRYVTGRDKEKVGYYDTKTVVHRKGHIVDLIGDNTDLGSNIAVYREMTEDGSPRGSFNTDYFGDRYAFTENVTLYVFANNAGCTCYDVYSDSGEYLLTQAKEYLSGKAYQEEFHSANVNFRADVMEESTEGLTAVHVENVKYSHKFNVVHCYNDHVVYVETWFFEDSYAWAVVQNSLYYTDATLTTHTSYSDQGDGIHYFASDTKIYTQIEEMYLYLDR